MYGIAYVVIPTEFYSLQAVLDEALAPFRRGGVDDFPSDKLAFDDVTETIRRLHREAITLKSDGAGIAVVGGSTMGSDLDFDALREFLLALCAPTWSGASPTSNPTLTRLRAVSRCGSGVIPTPAVTANG
jgi:hypothetical protein